MRRYRTDILLGACALALGAAALGAYSAAGDGVLRVLLWPHAKLTQAFFHITLSYQQGVGYVAAGHGFTIGAACMGMRFIVMLFCLVVCVFSWRFHGLRKALFFFLSLVGAVVVGVTVSCLRIIGSIPLLASGWFGALHAGIGITLYLAALVGVYYLLSRATGGSHAKTQ